jgi:hypothetical protein
MENESFPPGVHEASLTLAQAGEARRRLTEALVLPSFFFSSLGLVIALEIGTTAIGVTRQHDMGWLLVCAGWAAVVVVAAVQLWRFRRLNGVRVSGLAHRVMWGTADAAALGHSLALAAAIWAALVGVGWLVWCSAAAGGAAYAWSGQRWWRTYLTDPTRHGRPAPLVVLASFVAVAVLGIAALLVFG